MNTDDVLNHLDKSPPTIIEGGLPTDIVGVCAWCWPGESLFDVWPELRGRRLSHGQCPTCHARLLLEIAAMRRT